MRMLCEDGARRALAYAQTAKDPDTRQAWEEIADRWTKLAELFFDTCFCGRPAAATQRRADGTRKPLCGDHLHTALMHGARVEFTLANDG